MKMAPTESTLLSNYLLVPSQLASIISLEEFKELFPRSQQNSALVRTLYRDLQRQRAVLVEEVEANIEDETKHAKALRRAVVRARRAAGLQEQEDEVEIERSVR
jgi:centromere-localized protein 2